MFTCIPRNDSPSMRKVAEVATAIINRPSIQREIEDEVAREVASQLFYGNPPSNGLPDVRPRYPRYVPPVESSN